jgi:hypothetical protein
LITVTLAKLLSSQRANDTGFAGIPDQFIDDFKLIKILSLAAIAAAAPRRKRGANDAVTMQ